MLLGDGSGAKSRDTLAAMRKKSVLLRVLLFSRWLFTGSTAACLVCGAILAYRQGAFLQEAERATGIVTDFQVRTDSDTNADLYAPIVEFTAHDGRTYQVTSKTATSPAAYSVGGRIGILYRKSDPLGAQIDSFWQLWLAPLVLTFIAIAHGIFAGGLHWVARKIKQGAPGATSISWNTE